MGPPSGFTLLEVVVAVAILAVVLSVLYRAYTSNLEAVRIARNSAEVSQSARIVLERMRRDLESAFPAAPHEATPAAALGFRLSDDRLKDRPADRLDFTALSHLSFSAAENPLDLCEVGYHLEEGQAGEGMILYRRDSPSVDGDFASGGVVMELARRVAELEIGAADADGRMHASWPAPGLDPRELPRRITIRIVFSEDEDRERVFATSVHPPLSERAP